MLLAITALPAMAQESITGGPRGLDLAPTLGRTNLNWGVTPSAYHVSAITCNPLFSATVYSWTSVGVVSRYCTSGSCTFECPVHLPTGALISGIELDACDTNASARVWANFAKIPWTGSGSVVVIAGSDTTTPYTGGCGAFQDFTPTVETVDNWDYTY